MTSGEPDFIVIRFAEGFPEGLVPSWMDGTWFDRGMIPSRPRPEVAALPGESRAVAVPTGRFEYREDGAVAEVWEFRP